MSRELSTLAAAYALDALPSAERVDFEARLPEYPELEREVEELRSAAALLAAPTMVEAPARVRSAVLARISETRQLPPRVGAPVEVVAPVETAPHRPAAAPGVGSTATVTELGAHRARRAARISGGRRSFLVAAVAAVVAVGVVLGVQQVRPSTSSPIAAVLAQPDARVAQSSVGSSGSAILAWSETEKRVVVQVNALPDAPAGRTYQLWLIRASGAVSEGTFEPTSGSATLPADGLRGGDAVGITVEPAGGSRQPTTTPILKVTLT